MQRQNNWVFTKVWWMTGYDYIKQRGLERFFRGKQIGGMTLWSRKLQ